MSGNENFDDDGLKQAVCSAWAHECCPDALQSRLKDVCCGSSRSWGWARSLAIAAAVLIVASVAAFLSPGRSRSPHPAVAQQSMPPVLVADLIKTHDLCSRKPSHQHLSADIHDDAAMARELGGLLHQAVLVARPASPGWTFRGAAVCHVGAMRVGHLVFTDGGNTLSIFSLPASALPGVISPAPVDDVQSDHRVVAFKKDGALFCLVGCGVDACVQFPELIQMRDAMRNAVVEPTTIARDPQADLMYAMQ